MHCLTGYHTIAEGIAVSTGTASWVIAGEQIESRNDYYVQVSTVRAVTDLITVTGNSAVFKVRGNTDHLSITSPKKGETFNVGDVVEIRWEYTGLTGVEGVELSLCTVNSALCALSSTSISADTPLDANKDDDKRVGVATWKVPTLIDSRADYFLHVQTKDTFVSAVFRAKSCLRPFAPTTRLPWLSSAVSSRLVGCRPRRALRPMPLAHLPVRMRAERARFAGGCCRRAVQFDTEASSDFFRVRGTSDAITVLSPGAGQSFKANDKVDIEWEYTGLATVDTCSVYVS